MLFYHGNWLLGLLGEREMKGFAISPSQSPPGQLLAHGQERKYRSGCRAERLFSQPENLIFPDFQRNQDNKVI
jgi:hypothetical protein